MSGGQRLGGAPMLFVDASAALMVLNEARRRMIVRLFGIPRNESFVVTVILLSLLADALDDRTTAVRSGGPSTSDTMIAGVAAREVAHRVAGDASRGVPLFVGLVIAAVVWRNHPLARVSVRGGRASIHGAIASWRRARAYGGDNRSPPLHS